MVGHYDIAIMLIKRYRKFLRVIKPGGLISIGFTYVKDRENFEAKTNKTQENEIFSTSQLKEFFKNNIRTVYFEFDAFKDNPEVSRASILLLRVNK